MDNDCDRRTDDDDDDVTDGESFFDDLDGDGYGDATHGHTGLCLAPAGTVVDNTDCYDESAAAKPGTTTYSAVDRGDHSFDYDCDGLESPELSDISSTGTAGSDYGWVTMVAVPYSFASAGAVPACGTSGYYFTDPTRDSASYALVLAAGGVLAQSSSAGGWAVYAVSVACR